MKKTRNRTSEKRDRLITALRRAIVSGRYAPGEQLPTRVELARLHKVSVMTAQWVSEELAREGFIRSDATRGTFVTERPPHLHRYGLVLPEREDGTVDPITHQFCHALYLETMRLHRERGVDVAVYQNVTANADTPDARRLRADVDAGRVAGLIVGVSWLLEPSGILEACRERGIPVAGAGNREMADHGFVSVCHDNEALMTRALKDFAGRGRKRVAILSNHEPAGLLAEFGPRIEALGMETRLAWLPAARVGDTLATRSLAYLLTQLRERPDALLIPDDSFVEAATAGLKEGGIRVPDELDVLAHANFPYITPSALPIRRIGFDMREFAKFCIGAIDARRRGEDTPGTIPLSALFEDEVGI